MLALSSALFQRIVEVLLPHMDTEASRHGLLVPVFSNDAVYYQLDCTGDPQSFTVNLIKTLAHYGEIKQGEQALIALLQYVRTTVGTDEQIKIDDLVKALEALLPPKFATLDPNTSSDATVGLSSNQFTLLYPEFAAKNNLPIALTTFVGREQAMARITNLLAKTHLLTLAGPGGCGKTRLACEVAKHLAPVFTDGVWLVELAALSDSQGIPQVVAAVLGVREETIHPVLTTLMAYLQGKHLLLILDNCEHLIQSCASLVAALLRSVPRLWILVTSRNILNMEGETVLEIPPLALPENQHKVGLKRIARCAAIQLFVDRAQTVQPDFILTTKNASFVDKICRQLDGLPLAIELAAARLKLLTVEEIAARLDDRFQLLVGGSRTASPHHRTLRAAMNWSYELLDNKEQAFFNALAIFAGGFTLAAAVAIVEGVSPNEYQVLEWLSSLIEKSMIQVEKMADDTVRYRMLETLRQCGQEKLHETMQDGSVRQRHFVYYLMLAEQAELALRGPRQNQWLMQMRTEHDNLRAALVWIDEIARCSAASNDEWSAKGLRLAGALCRFWELQGYLDEGRRWVTQMLALPGAEQPTALRAKALNGAGALVEEQGDYKAAQTFYEESLAIWRQLDEQSGVAEALNDLGKIATFQGDYGKAQTLGEQSLLIRRMLDDTWGIAVSLTNLGNIARYQGNYEVAQALYQESLEGFKKLGDKWAIAVALNNLGLVAMKQGNFSIARTFLEDSLAIAQEIQDKQGVAYAFQNLGELAYRCDDCAVAHRMHVKGLESCVNLGDKEGIAHSLAAFALLAKSKGDAQKAVQLFGAEDALRRAINAPLASDETGERKESLNVLCGRLGTDEYGAAWNQGQVLTWQEAVDLAVAEM